MKKNKKQMETEKTDSPKEEENKVQELLDYLFNELGGNDDSDEHKYRILFK